MKEIFKLRFQIFLLQLKIVELEIDKIIIHIKFFWNMMILKIKKMFLLSKIWVYNILFYKSDPIKLEEENELRELFNKYM